MIAADRPDRRSPRLVTIDADGGVRHLACADLASLFDPGDLVVVNDAATLPASLTGTHCRSGEPIEIRLAAWVSIGNPTRFSEAATAYRLGERLAVRRQAALVFCLPPMPRDEARRRIADVLAEIVASVPRPDAIVSTGGETAFSLCRALRAGGLTALGWTAPGIPLSRVEGGLWPSLPLVTKSGAFGSPETLRQLTLQISGGASA